LWCTVRRGNAAAAQLLGDPIVELLDPVVPLLVQLVDCTLDLRDLRIAGRRRAGFVLLMPKAKIVAKLLADVPQKAVVRIVDLLLVPAGDTIAMQGRYGFQRNHSVVSNLRNRKAPILSRRRTPRKRHLQ
jgi:hypothetical protein